MQLLIVVVVVAAAAAGVGADEGAQQSPQVRHCCIEDTWDATFPAFHT